MNAFTVMVPCSTSNLGPGFDSLGLALGGPDLMVRCVPGGEGLRIASIEGDDGQLPRDSSNRIVQAALRTAGARALDAELSIHTSIPLKRGLGSSAAAALAGALIADRLCDGEIGEEGVLHAAVEMEGHPDNVVPSLRGGLQVSTRLADGRTVSCAVAMPRPFRAALFIPATGLSTAEARAVLPKQVSLADAVFNLSRASLLVAALASGTLALIGDAMEDRLHQPARGTLLTWLPGIIAAARAGGALGASLSGAGSTVFALCTPDTARQAADAMSAFAAAHRLEGSATVVDVGVPGARVVV